LMSPLHMAGPRMVVTTRANGIKPIVAAINVKRLLSDKLRR
jgi:hypothetical protein